MRLLGPECCLLLNLHHGAPVSTSPEGRRDAERTIEPGGTARERQSGRGGDVQGDLIMAR